MTLRIGSMCSGYGGLDMAVHEALGGELAWVADLDPGACAILAHRLPRVPNLGDITAADWSTAEPVDVLTAGFPCQDISLAGKRAGMRKGTRSGIWTYVAAAIDALRPSLVVLENVRSLTSAAADSDVEPCPWCLGDSGEQSALRALGAVLGDLADIGFDAEWVCVGADDAGAPHRRKRIFIVAWPAADAQDSGRDELNDGGQPGAHGPQPVIWRTGMAGHDRGGRLTPAHPHGTAGGERRIAAPGQAPGGRSRADAGRPGGMRAIAEARSEGLEVRAVEPHRDERPAVERGRGDVPADADRQDAGPDARGGGAAAPAGPGDGQERRSESGPSVGGGTPADTASDGRDARRPDNANRWHTPDGYCTSLRPGEMPCPGCGCPDDFRDSGGFCAGPCGGNCTDPVLGRPDGGWNSFKDDADPADVRAYALAHSAGIRHGDAREAGERGIPAAAVPGTPADADRDGLARGAERHGEPQRGQAGHEQRRVDPLRRVLDWGNYAPAIHRWEAVLGQAAPRPTEPGRTGERLSPRFVEFLMGLPEGWVTDVPGLSRNAQLKALGNGVVPAQAAMALRLLLERSGLLPLVAADLTSAEGGEAA